MTDSEKALVAFVSALVVALFAAIFAYGRYTREQRNQQQTLLNALFAELGNILEHYTYAASELPIDSQDQFELKKRLKWATFGPLRSVNDIGKLGFLDASNIKSLLQLELLNRNDNTYLNQLLEDEDGRTKERLVDIKGRLRARAKSAASLLEGLVAKKPELTRAMEELKGQLP